MLLVLLVGFCCFLLDGADGVGEDSSMSSRSPSPGGGAQHSDSGQSRSGRDEDMGSEGLTWCSCLVGRRRYRGGGRPGIRGRGRGRVAAGRRREHGGSGEGRGSVSGVGGRSSRGGRGTGRGVGAKANDWLTDCQREILVNGWKQQDTPGPSTFQQVFH